MSTDNIAAIVTALGDLVTVVKQAEPAVSGDLPQRVGHFKRAPSKRHAE